MPGWGFRVWQGAGRTGSRAIVRRPAVLLADEPTASLDEENGRRLMDLMLAYQKEAGCFLLCATHDTRVMDRFTVRYDVQKGAFL